MKQLIDQDPNCHSIDLEASQLTLIDSASLTLLGKFPHLKSLNVAENYLTKLPMNMSNLKCLEELNLTGNPIENIE